MGDAGDIDVQGLQALGQGALSAIAAPADQKQQDAMQQGDLEQMQGITSVKRDGEKTTITGTNAMIDYLHKSLMEGAQLKHHVSQVEQVLQGELQKVQNRENAYNRSPILSALANIAGNMAQQHNMPGVVQALGRSSVQLNPGPLAIQGQKMNILEALDQAHRTSVADERADFNQNLQLAEFGERTVKMQQEEQNRVRDDRGKFEARWDGLAQKGFIDPQRMAQEAVRSKVYSADEIPGLIASTQDAAKIYKRMRDMGIEEDTKKEVEKTKAVEGAKMPFEQKMKQFEADLTEKREKAVKKYESELKSQDETVKLTGTERKAIGDVLVTKDLATKLRELVLPLAEKEGTGIIGQGMAKVSQMGKAGLYAAGLDVNDPIDNKIIQLSSLMKILGAKPYMGSVRRLEYIQQIQQHIPNEKMTNRAKLQRLTDILPIYDMLMADIQDEARSASGKRGGASPLADDFVKYLKSIPPGQMAKNTDRTWWTQGKDGTPTQVSIDLAK